jgi:hypothetical protein
MLKNLLNFAKRMTKSKTKKSQIINQTKQNKRRDNILILILII